MTSLQRQFERAREIAPYADDALVERITREIVGWGVTILQTHKLAPTDRGHVGRLLGYFAPPKDARVLDVGCGVGAIAVLMAGMRPDLAFTLLNISPAQLAMAPPLPKLCGDMHAIPASDASFDAVMFNFSLGHGLLDACIAEAARVLRSGGVLFIYDIATNDHDLLIERLGYRPHAPEEVIEAAGRHGLVPTLVDRPDGNTDIFEALFGSLAAHGLDRTWPMIFRFTK